MTHKSEFMQYDKNTHETIPVAAVRMAACGENMVLDCWSWPDWEKLLLFISDIFGMTFGGLQISYE